jgi:hypothetical protein
MSTYATGMHRLLGSFVNPVVLLTKEAARYSQLLALMPPLELAVGAAAPVLSEARRGRSDGSPSRGFVSLIAAIVMNNHSPLYFIHVLPALVVPIAPLLSHGVSGGSQVTLRALTPRALAASIVCIAVLWPAAPRVWRAAEAHRGAVESTAAVVERVRAIVDRRCRAAGDAGFYVPYLADYAYFISLRDLELNHEMLFHRTSDEAAYWGITRPDAVSAPGGLRPGLSQYVHEGRFVEPAPAIWINPARCRGMDRR